MSPTTLEKRLAGVAAQQRVEVAELAALAFLADPRALAGVPAARSVQQEEIANRRRHSAG